MSIPSDLKPFIAQVRQQYHQLASAPDEVVAQMILEAMQQQSNPRDDTDMENRSAEELRSIGEHLLDACRWEEAQKCFFVITQVGRFRVHG